MLQKHLLVNKFSWRWADDLSVLGAALVKGVGGHESLNGYDLLGHCDDHGLHHYEPLNLVNKKNTTTCNTS